MMTNKENLIENVYIIQPILNDNYRVLHDEAIALIESADALYCGSTFQNIKEINPATFFGSGKLLEIRERLREMEVDNITILFNGTLSPSQTLNISAILDDRKVIDRTTLILDIFAKNAISSEGKIQVELAQLKYIYPRLKGKGAALSKLGGGIGSRGPGETQLETDRRHIRYRIKYLESKLNDTEIRRKQLIQRREKDHKTTIALVGYTNTGKSTLLNLLTGANVLAKDALFATLDPTSRKFEIDGIEFLMIDTVGFLQELPHNIIEAFKSTLEVALYSDLAIIVCDATGDYEMQYRTTTDTLAELGFHQKTLKVLNKCENITDPLPPDFIPISAKNNLGIERLKREIFSNFNDRYVSIQLLIPYDQIQNYMAIKNYINEKEAKYNDYGLEVNGLVEKSYRTKFDKWKRG